MPSGERTPTEQEQLEQLQTQREKQRKSAWEYYKHADTLFAMRFNYYMVAQSMMLVSFSAITSSDLKSIWPRIIAIVIASFGFWYAIMQYIMNNRLFARMTMLTDDYLKIDDSGIYSKYLNTPLDFSKIPFLKIIPLSSIVEKIAPNQAGHIQTKWVPSAFGIVWLIFLVIAVFLAVSNLVGQAPSGVAVIQPTMPSQAPSTPSAPGQGGTP